MQSRTSISRSHASKAISVFALVLFAGALCLPTVAAAAEPYRSILAQPQSPGAVSAPAAVVADPGGGVAVADSGNDRVCVYDASGQLLHTLGLTGTAAADLSNPLAVAVGPDGYYVADTGNNRVQVYDNSGQWVRTIPAAGSVDAPAGIAVGSDGTVYVSSLMASTIKVYRPDGSSATWGGPGVEVGKLTNPRGLAVSGNNLYIADTGMLRVQIWNTLTGPPADVPYGQLYLYQLGIEENPNPPYDTVSRYLAPWAVTVAPNGDLLVTDRNGSWVQRVAATSPYAQVAQWGIKETPGTGSLLTLPSGAVVTADGTFYCADTGNDRIARYNGGPLADWSAHSSGDGLSHPAHLDLDSEGGPVVADRGNLRIASCNREGTRTATFGDSFVGPEGVAIAANGDRYVSDAPNNAIKRFTAEGVYVGTFGQSTLNSPRGIDFDSSGTLYVADSGNNRIVRFTSDGTYIDAWGTFGSGDKQFNSPSDVAVDQADSAIWIADTGNHRIQKLALSTGNFRIKVPTVNGSGSDSGQFVAPEGVGLDAAGGVVVADTGNDRVQRIGRDGSVVEVIGETGVALGQFHAPSDAAVAADGRLWVLERGGARLQAFVVDASGPTVSALGIPAAPVNVPVQVTLAATDTPAGVATVYYRLNNGLPQTYTGPITIGNEGTTTVGWWAVDRLDNASTEQTRAVVIDTTPPHGTVVLGTGAFWNPGNPLVVSSAFPDAVQMRVGYGAALGTWGQYEETTQVAMPDVDGRYTVRVEYADFLGNATVVQRSMGYDRVGPSAPLVSSPTHPAGVLVRFGTTADFTWQASTDAVSGPSRYAFALDQLPDTTPSSPDTPARSAHFTGITGGTWYFHVRAKDVAGNWGQVSHYQILVTSTPHLTVPLAARSLAAPGSATYKFTGFVTPAHDGCAIRVTALRLVGRDWVSTQTKDAAVSSVGGMLRYRGTITLPAGVWRLRATHLHHGGFETSYSPYSPAFAVR